MNTTIQNHSKILNLIMSVNPYPIYRAYSDKNISDGTIYFNLIKENKLSSMKEILYFFFKEVFTYIENGCSDSYHHESLIQLIEFTEENFPNHNFYSYKKILGKKVFGDKDTWLIERAINRKETGKEETLNMDPYILSTESDYETAIEIVTTNVYAVPFHRINSCLNEEAVFVSFNKDDYTEFSTSTSNYDKRAYGTHYM